MPRPNVGKLTSKSKKVLKNSPLNLLDAKNVYLSKDLSSTRTSYLVAPLNLTENSKFKEKSKETRMEMKNKYIKIQIGHDSKLSEE